MTPPPSTEQHLTPREILELALKSPTGIVVEHEDCDALRRQLYIEIRKAREKRDLSLDGLEIRAGRISGQLMIVPKNEAE